MKHANVDERPWNKWLQTVFFTVIFFLSSSVLGFAQQVKGTVVDVKGEPIIGASVVVKETPTLGTITDLDGKFTLDVPKSSVLVISYIGYTTQEVPAKSIVKVVLKEDNEVLDEVVVIGYGTQRKGDVTSAVASVKSENFVKGAVKDVGQLIQGKVAGLAITNPSGDPTGEYSDPFSWNQYYWWCQYSSVGLD